MRFNWGAGVALVYGVFAACTMTFVVFAMRQPVQLVSEDYYARSLRHDERRAAIENAQGLAADVVSLSADGRAVSVALPAAHARDARGAARLYRPSDSQADRSVPLSLDADGHQALSLDGLASGRWVVQVGWISGGRAYYREVAVMLP